MRKGIGKLLTFIAALFFVIALSNSPVKADVNKKVPVSSGDAIASTLNQLFLEAKDYATDSNPYVITVPKGSYVLEDQLHIYSNTKLVLDGVTLTYSQNSGNFIMTGLTAINVTKDVAGYSGYRNITIKGGTFKASKTNTSCIMRFQHATNLTLDGCTLVGGGGGHQIEGAAINKWTIKNCTFKDFEPVQVEGSSYEALQIDIPCNTYVFQDAYLDGTPCKNISITGCTFSNVPRGVGSHTHLEYKYVENVDISNNTFTNIAEMAITAVDYYNCTIKNNTMTDCGQGIVFSYGRNTAHSMYTTTFDGAKKTTGSTKYDAKTEISGNTIVIKYNPANQQTAAIRVQGFNWTKEDVGGDNKKFAAHNYYILGVSVLNNNITTAGYGIHLYDARDCKVAGNKIIGKNFSDKDENIDKYVGIRVSDESSGIDLSTKNEISGMIKHGIYVMTSSSVANIKNQVIKDCGGSGIQFYDNSSCEGEISNNAITGCKDGGIYINVKATVNLISQNTIKGVSGKPAISAFQGIVTTISDNIISDCGKDDNTYVSAIKIGTNSTCTNITGNTIQIGEASVSCGRGIEIYSQSTLSGSISGNFIYDCADIAIKVGTSSKCTNIQNNTIAKSKTSKAAVRAIDVDGSSVNKITKNKISNCSSTGILVYSKGKVTGEINGNTITNCKDGGIYVNGNGTVQKAINNTIKKVTGKPAISANGGTINNIQTNTIIDCGQDASKNYVTAIKIGTNSTCVNITGNTIKADATTISCGRGIEIYSNSSLTGEISGNFLYDCSDIAIKVGTNSTCAAILDNTIAKTKASVAAKRAIDVDGSTVTTIKGNKISNCSATGILVYTKGKVTGEISGNTISSCKDGGIYVNGGGTVQKANSNTLTKISGKPAISANGGTINYIQKNKIRDCGKDSSKAYVAAIKIGTNSKCKKITGNTIEAPTTTVSCIRGIEVYNNSSVSELISENKIYDCVDAAIKVGTKSTCGTISKNTIAKSKASKSCKRGIEIYSDSKVTGSIVDNVMSDVNEKGIAISSKSTVTKDITNNTISKAGNSGIYIEALKNNLKIEKNTLTGIGNHGIFIKDGNNAFTITVKNNKVTTKSSVNGIHMLSGKVDMSGNTITSANRAIFLDKGMSGTVGVNTFKKCKVNVYIGKAIKEAKAPGLTSVAGASKALTVKLKKAANATKYEIQTATDKSFKKNVASTLVAASKTSANVSKLKAKTTYYARVRSCVIVGKLTVYSAWTDAKNAKTK